MEWLQTGFGLVMGFIEHFNTQLVTALYKPLSHNTLVFSATVFSALLGNAFQQ
jgi:hypothetical protein